MQLTRGHLPLAQIGLEVNDGLGALDISEALSPHVEHLIRGLGKQTANVDVGLTGLVLQATVEWLMRRARSGNSSRDRRLLMH